MKCYDCHRVFQKRITAFFLIGKRKIKPMKSFCVFVQGTNTIAHSLLIQHSLPMRTISFKIAKPWWKNWRFFSTGGISLVPGLIEWKQNDPPEVTFFTLLDKEERKGITGAQPPSSKHSTFFIYSSAPCHLSSSLSVRCISSPRCAKGTASTPASALFSGQRREFSSSDRFQWGSFALARKKTPDKKTCGVCGRSGNCFSEAERLLLSEKKRRPSKNSGKRAKPSPWAHSSQRL